MAAKFKTVKQLYAQDKDFVLFPNTCRCTTCCDRDLQTYDLAKRVMVVKSGEECTSGMLLFAST